MPRVPRKRRLRHESLVELAIDQEHYLLGGWRSLGGFPDRASFEAAWRLHRDTLLPDFIADYPGHRPFAWWLLERRKERPVLDGCEPPETLAEILAYERERPEHFGFLHACNRAKSITSASTAC